MSGPPSRTSAQTTEVVGLDMERHFRESLQGYLDYPFSLINLFDFERENTVKSYRYHFSKNCDKLFDETLTCVPIRDFGSTQATSLAYGIKRYDIEKLADLDALQWPSEEGHDRLNLPKDPKCRFILLERANWIQPLMNVNKDILFRILTYHQVAPCYLNFLICSSSQTGASDIGFSGFRPHLSLSNPGHAIHELNRSGRHYQLALKLESTRTKLGTIGWTPDSQEDAAVNMYKYPTAVVYHQFDIETGTALWILSSPLQPPLSGNTHPENHLWKGLKNSLAIDEYLVAADTVEDRFHASLKVLIHLAEWSIGDLEFYLQHIDEDFEKVTLKYLYPFQTEGDDGDDEGQVIVEKDLRKMTVIQQALERCRIRVEDNIRVFESLRAFYSCNITSHFAAIAGSQTYEQHIQRFSDVLEMNIERTKNLLRRVLVLENLIASRAEFVQKLLENGTNRTMKKLTIVTSDDSSTMRIFAFITLILLPVTVVSTVMGTEMVTFNDIPDGSDTNSTGGSGGGKSTIRSRDKPIYFSWLAFKVWITAGLILTSICLGISWLWQKLEKVRRDKGSARKQAVRRFQKIQRARPNLLQGEGKDDSRSGQQGSDGKNGSHNDSGMGYSNPSGPLPGLTSTSVAPPPPHSGDPFLQKRPVWGHSRDTSSASRSLSTQQTKHSEAFHSPV